MYLTRHYVAFYWVNASWLYMISVPFRTMSSICGVKGCGRYCLWPFRFLAFLDFSLCRFVLWSCIFVAVPFYHQICLLMSWFHGLTNQFCWMKATAANALVPNEYGSCIAWGVGCFVVFVSNWGALQRALQFTDRRLSSKACSVRYAFHGDSKKSWYRITCRTIATVSIQQYLSKQIVEFQC